MTEPLATNVAQELKNRLIKELQKLRKHEKNVCCFCSFLLQ